MGSITILCTLCMRTAQNSQIRTTTLSCDSLPGQSMNDLLQYAARSLTSALSSARTSLADPGDDTDWQEVMDCDE